MWKTVLLLALTYSCQLLANQSYVILEKNNNELPRELIQKIRNSGYDVWGINDPERGYIRVRKGNKFTIADSSGNILKASFDYITPVTRHKLFFAGDNQYGRNDYGKQETQYISGLKAYSITGNEVSTSLSLRQDLEFATNQVFFTKYYTTPDNDYLTVFKKSDDGYDHFAGLIDGQGNIIIEPSFHEITHLYGYYFLARNRSNVSKIYDVRTQEYLPESFEDIQLHSENIRSTFGLSYIVFNDAIIAKSNGGYGIYSLAQKKWLLPNHYQQLEPITGSVQPDPDLFKFHRVIFTDKFKAKQNGKWGVVSDSDQVLVPIEHAYVESVYSKWSYFRIFKKYERYNEKEQLMNLYEVKTKKILLNKYYREVFLDENQPDVAIVTVGDNKIMILDLETNQTLVSAEEGFKSYNYSSKGVYSLKHQSDKRFRFSLIDKVFIDPKPQLSPSPATSNTKQSIITAKACNKTISSRNTNLAISANIKAGSTFCSGSGSDCYDVKRVNDGDTSTDLGGYDSWVNLPGKSKEISMDWGGEAITAEQITIYTTANYPVSKYEIMLNTHQGWKPLILVSNNKKSRLCHGFEPIEITAIKFMGKRGPSSQKAYIRVNEISIH